MEDLNLECTDCTNMFTFTVGEQEFYESKGFESPKRCMDCRKQRKMNRKNVQNNTRNYKPRHNPNQQEWKIICMDCGNNSIVPFKPKGDCRCKTCHLTFIENFKKKKKKKMFMG